ncbi:uncharacterized protein LOC141715479 [Apium graveolens]|uniref:uncharacterized protein LOC141715447 n=1 Tax=Apium graveolens TaxID=4045 RepID=UPI003D7A0522
MLKWAVELGQFDLEYYPRTVIKGQALADFVLEFDSEVDEKAMVLAEPSSRGDNPEKVKKEFPHPWWILHIDEAVNSNRAGVGIIPITPKGHSLMSSIHFKFHVTNNDAKYEALINGLKMTLEVGVVNLIARSDSELVINQVNGGFQARGPRTELYMRYVQCLLKEFGNIKLEGMPGEENGCLGKNGFANGKCIARTDSIGNSRNPMYSRDECVLNRRGSARDLDDPDT